MANSDKTGCAIPGSPPPPGTPHSHYHTHEGPEDHKHVHNCDGKRGFDMSCHEVKCNGHNEVLNEWGTGCMRIEELPPNSCTKNQRILGDGSCVYCHVFQMRTSGDPWSCSTQTCTSRQKLHPMGYCEECPAYQKSMKYFCAAEKCCALSFLRPDGTCE